MKIINSFNLDLSDLPAVSEARGFTVSGTNGAIFSLEIKNEDSYYYIVEILLNFCKTY